MLLKAVAWTRISGAPQKMAVLTLDEAQIRIEYTRNYQASGLPKISLLDDVATSYEREYSFPVSERMPVLPRLRTLIPGQNPRNLQREHYLRYLQKELGHPPPQNMETEWRLLTLGGHGGIGHVDIFENDARASHWYQGHARNEAPASVFPGSIWGLLRQVARDEYPEVSSADIDALLGPTPSVGGMIPKLLASMNPGLDENIIYAPDTAGKTNVLLKVEPPEYTGSLALEALCLDLHAEAGFIVPDYRLFHHKGLPLLAVTRFDQNHGKPVPMESLMSVLATADWEIQGNNDLFLEELGEKFDALNTVLPLPEDTLEHLYRRILMAHLTGNGDLHLDNLALLGGRQNVHWSPVYDPTPMRAWPRHDMVSSIPYDTTRSYSSFGHMLVELGPRWGISSARSKACIHDALAVCTDFAERVLQCDSVPVATRERLANIVINCQEDLRKAVSMG